MVQRSVFFEPWVGKNYLQGGILKQKVLILGESHYCPLRKNAPPCPCDSTCLKEACHTMTQDVINDILYDYNGDHYMRTFTCFERAVFGRIPTQEEREDFWNSVAFYNYYQYAFSGPRRIEIRPETDSEDAFRQVLSELMPDKIIVWGQRLYNMLPDWGGAPLPIKAENGDTTDGWIYTINGKPIECMVVHHPSSPTGKSWENWHLFHKVFLNL